MPWSILFTVCSANYFLSSFGKKQLFPLEAVPLATAIMQFSDQLCLLGSIDGQPNQAFLVRHFLCCCLLVEEERVVHMRQSYPVIELRCKTWKLEVIRFPATWRKPSAVGENIGPEQRDSK